MWAHLAAVLVLASGLVICLGGFLGWLPPLIIRGGKGQRSPFVRDQATEALNFQLFTLIVSGAFIVVSIVLTIVTFGIFIFVWMLGALAIFAFQIVFGIIAAVAANNGTAYRYPINWRMVR
jgi:uncharacterized Tic20 family protein